MAHSKDLFAQLEPAHAQSLRDSFPIEQWSSGDVLLKQGEPNKRIHLIESGDVEVWRGEVGQPDAILITTLHSGDCLGEMSTFDDLIITTTVVARTAVTTRSFIPEDVTEKHGVRSSVVTNLARSLVRRLVKTNDNLVAKHAAERNTQELLLASLMMVGQILVTVSLYVFLLPIAEQLKSVLPSDSLVSFGFIIFLTALTWEFQRASPLARSAYGLDFRN